MNILDFKNSEIFVDILVCRHHRSFWDFGTHFLTFWYWVIFSDILVLPEQKNLEYLKIFLTFWYVTISVNIRFAQILIMKIMLTDIHGIIIIMSWKLRVFPIFRSNYANNLDRNIDPRERPKFSRHYGNHSTKRPLT